VRRSRDRSCRNVSESMGFQGRSPWPRSKFESGLHCVTGRSRRAAASLCIPVAAVFVRVFVSVARKGGSFPCLSYPYRSLHPILGTVYLLGTEANRMPDIDIETLIRKRADFLKRHPRPGDFGVRFNRDFMEQHGLPLLCEIDSFDSGNWVQCTCQTLLGYVGSEADRKRLQRALRRLVADGTVERSGRSAYRFKTAEPAKV